MKRSVLDYLENTAKRCPERLAWDASASFTFGQWWDAAQRIASSLSSWCARNTPVAVLMNPRSAECVKVFFGVWAAGCFYAPLDPMLPPERLKLIMQNLQQRRLSMMKKAVRKRKLFARMGANACCGRTRRSRPWTRISWHKSGRP